MNIFSCMKKRLTVFALAMAMFASILCGVLFIGARAENMSTANLVTVSDPSTVTPAKKYTMLANSTNNTAQAGEEVGGAGLYIDVPEANAGGYNVDINGVFTGSAGFKVRFPGEGWWNDSSKEVIVTVASVSDPASRFQIHLSGPWQQYAYVTYEWAGQTLYRTADTYDRTDWGYPGYFDYEKYHYSYAACADYNLIYLPVIGNFDAEDSFNREFSGYIGIEQDPADETVWYAVMYSGRGTKLSGRRKKIAKFSNEPTTFVPETEGNGTDPSLPRIELNDGYTVSFSLKDTNDQKSFDMIIDGIAVSENGDPYNMKFENGVISETPANEYRMDVTTLSEVPDFYTRWQNVPVITVADDDFDAVRPVNKEIILPEATYTTRVNDKPQAVTDISYKFGDSGWQPATDSKFTPDQAGVYTVRYLVDGVYSAQIEITVRDDVTFAETQLADLVRVSDNATAKANAQYIVGSDPKKTDDTLAPEEVDTPIGDPGLLVTPNNFEAQDPYTVDLVGVFEGNTAIEWSVPGENWDTASNVIFTIADVADPSNSFQVIWTGANQSPAYVRYNYTDSNGDTQQLLRVSNGSDTSYAMYDGTRPGEGADETQFGRIGDNYFAKFKPYKGAWNTVSERTPGLLSLEWTEDGALNIVALNDMGSRTVMASFCEEPETFVPVDTETTKTKKGLDYNLPKLTFEHGYTISVEVTSNAMFMLFDVTTGGETTSFAAESQNYEPAFYTQGKQIPVFGEVQSIADVVLGTEVNVPALGYTTYGGTTGTVSDIKWGPVGGDMTAVTDNKFTVTGEGGDYVVRYTVTALGVDFVKEVTFHACNYTTPGTVLEEATCTTDGEGWFSCVHDHSIVKTIPATGHTYGEQPEWAWEGVAKATATFTCTKGCGHKETKEAAGTAITSAVTTPATCTTEGVRTYTATVTLGEQQYTNEKTEEIPVDPDAHDATLVHVEGKAATCTEAGVKAHYKCNSCEATFEDAEGTKPMADVTIPAKGHDMQKVEAVAPTCEAGGNSEYYECSVCHKQFKDAAGKTETTAEKCALKPLGHNVKKVDGKAPTCTEDGNSGYYKCENCGACYSDSKGEMNIDESSMILKATGHKYENGVCTVCGAADPAAAEDEGGCGSAVSVAGVSVLLAGAVLAAAGGLFLGRKKRS